VALEKCSSFAMAQPRGALSGRRIPYVHEWKRGGLGPKGLVEETRRKGNGGIRLWSVGSKPSRLKLWILQERVGKKNAQWYCLLNGFKGLFMPLCSETRNGAARARTTEVSTNLIALRKY